MEDKSLSSISFFSLHKALYNNLWKMEENYSKIIYHSVSNPHCEIFGNGSRGDRHLGMPKHLFP
jgi:hypothetical protein